MTPDQVVDAARPPRAIVADDVEFSAETLMRSDMDFLVRIFARR